jgi:hypothetical protein
VVREVTIQAHPFEVPAKATPHPSREPCPVVPESEWHSVEVITDTIPVDPQYYPAMLVVTQFLTYLDSGQYDWAYDLVSPHLEDYGTYNYYKTKEQFREYYRYQYDKVCLYTVEPTLDIGPGQPGIQSSRKLAESYGLDEDHYKQVHVVLATYSIHRDESELTPSGFVRNLFFGVAKEDDGAWRIINWRRYPAEEPRDPYLTPTVGR